MVKLTKQTEERHSESRMRQIRKSGSMRGREASDGFSPYSTLSRMRLRSRRREPVDSSRASALIFRVRLPPWAEKLPG